MNRMKIAEPYRALLDAALRQGWTVRLTHNGHIRWQPPQGQDVVFSPSTPSCHRGIANVRSKLRRAGLAI